ncbi:unnamed protein product, partial [marine sediment metagenome]
CIADSKECDITFGRGEYIGVWHKINAGKIQACPARTGGTMAFDHKEGLRNIDIADHKFNVVESMEGENDQT